MPIVYMYTIMCLCQCVAIFITYYTVFLLDLYAFHTWLYRIKTVMTYNDYSYLWSTFFSAFN